MFGTMGFSELIIILVIVLIIFGAGRLPQIGEGVGKALKGFRKEVNDVPQPASGQVQPETGQPQAIQTSTNIVATVPPPTTGSSTATTRPHAPYAPGPELTPGTTASLLYNTSLQTPQPSAPSPNQASASASSDEPQIKSQARSRSSAHSASRSSSFCCSAARSKGAGPQPAAAAVAMTMEQERTGAIAHSPRRSIRNPSTRRR